METINIYNDIATRTGGDIYIGVVGPVRSGKSTFIKQFMDKLVIPNIKNEYDRSRASDELPQSASGRTVMTTEPKFIPDEAIEITVADSASLKVRMIDCVGYIVPDVLGHIENGSPRMVMTPWSDSPMPFEQAAEYGTKKVITDHSTIGILVTTDGSIGEIPRSSYIDAEKRVADELTSLNKPFVIVLNTADTSSDSSVNLAYELEEKYGAPVALVNCLELTGDDIRHILEMVLLEFPVREIGIELPAWTSALDENHWLRKKIFDSVIGCAEKIHRTGEIESAFAEFGDGENIRGAETEKIDLGIGSAILNVTLADGLYYRIISELTGLKIGDEEALIGTLTELSDVKMHYDKIKSALDDVNEKGYGIVTPSVEDLHLEEPQIVKQQGGYGVRFKASAPSIHLIKATIETEINPVVGSEAQSEELVQYLMKEFESEPAKLWESNMFGKSLHELVSEGLNTKIYQMPEESRTKLSETLSRLINEGSSGLICIIL